MRLTIGMTLSLTLPSPTLTPPSVHTVHIIVTQYPFLFGIRQTLHSVGNSGVRGKLRFKTDCEKFSLETIPIAFSQYKRSR